MKKLDLTNFGEFLGREGAVEGDFRFGGLGQHSFSKLQSDEFEIKMYAVERLSNYISRGVYTVSGPFHPFGGAVDIIVVQQQDGSFKSSPWYVRFGKFQGVLKTKEKIVNISVNGAEADFHMYLDHKGEAYFLTEVEGEEGDFSSSSGEETDDKSENGKLIKALSLNIDDKPPLSLTDIDMGNGKVLTRTGSKRSRILGLMFGRKSVKEDSMHWKGEDNVGRVSSLESAKIAADLLEVKWSTDLKAHRRQGASTPQPSDLKLLDKGANKEHMGLVEEDGKDSQADKNQKDLGSPVVNDNSDHSAIGLVLHENVEVTEMYIMKKEYSDEITSPRSLFTGNHEQAVEGSISESNYLLDAGEMCHKEPTREKIEVNAENERPSQEENGREVSSFVYFEATETSTLGIQDSNEKFGKVPPGGLEEVEVHAEALISELSSQLESVVLTSEKNSGGFDDIESYISNSVETKVVEVIHQTTVVEGEIPDKTLETDQKEILVNQAQVEVVEFSSPNLFRYECGVDHVDTSTVPNSGVVDQIMDSYKEGVSGATCTLSHLEDPHGHPQKVGNQREEEIHELDISSEVSVSLQEPGVKSTLEKVANSGLRFKCSEEDHILFSDIDKVQAGRAHNNETDSQLAEYNKEEDHWLNDISHNSPLSSSHQSFESPLSRASASYAAEFVQEAFSHESLPEEPRTPGTSINIPRSWFHSEEVEKLLGSLPINRTHIHDVERSDSHRPLSRSLDLTLENSNRDMLGGFPNVLKPSASESNLSQVMSPPEGVKAMGGAWLPQEDKYVSTNFAVEMSLCKHLLSEGMGAEAATQAFDSEKLNLEKFTSLGPSVVKNDRLIVRISGRYFPWESAASIILGRAAFGKEHIFEPEGAIAVEQVEKPLDEGSIPSGGSWRLWPFNFGKSKSMSLVPISPDITKGIEGEFLSIDGDCNTLKTRATKKKVPSLVPTSDQLASLNLKEGRNVITFTFSTAMLGRQQVDARIYLWKWNTRIVISDVDGTITRSDVLGQFMPLVGKDWSQTGVAHLFSAIKENGYQLLFLSARAISQAYLTRQFLVNLKQDGKVLPDGPVVISPDGLFPSLYREVIRRAPHEFKIACLEEIRALFPLDCNPFYAGFGNRDTDEISYLKVGIPKGKIFIINPKGEVVVNRRLDTKSYTSLHALVNGMFPAMSSSEQEDFNSWNYWKMPLPEINI